MAFDHMREDLPMVPIPGDPRAHGGCRALPSWNHASVRLRRPSPTSLIHCSDGTP